MKDLMTRNFTSLLVELIKVLNYEMKASNISLSTEMFKL